MAKKRSNGEGSITYDKRRKRYRAKVTVGWEMNEETGRTKQITKSIGSNFKTRGEAARALAEYQNESYNLENKDITFEELFEIWYPEYIQKHPSYKYVYKSAYAYMTLLYKKKFRNITILDMKKCIEEGTIICKLGSNKGNIITPSPQVKQNMKGMLNKIYDYALEGRIVNINYARNFYLDKEVFDNQEKNKVPRIPFSQQELDIMWKAKNFVPFVDMILYHCYSGWRPKEIITLKIEDVHLEEEYIVGGIKTKAGRQRTVPIHPLVKPIVEKYYNEAISIGSAYLFNDITKKKGLNGLSKDQYYSRFIKVVKQLKLNPELTPHCARHTFITKAKSREVNMNEYILKMIVGHKIQDVTESVYTHRTIEDLKEEILKIKS
ncbi:site-specific integrase [Eubacterium sp.]|uniref:tyrosine-type recombinase/integrase n=1 Tax=Eubacterium sp. TaxID=142586 RepID=UPI001D55A8A7|nr:site-specific integrase [Eubacterium sp.]MBS5619694.1 site-specific integrase [Eubacterium sp.]